MAVLLVTPRHAMKQERSQAYVTGPVDFCARIGRCHIDLQSCAGGADGDPLAAIQQKLNSQFKLTTTTANLSDIVSAGDVVALQKNGLKMSALSALATESNTYKDGKIGGGRAKE